MLSKRIVQNCTQIGSCVAVCLFLATPAFAVTIWTDWTSATVGELGTATGTLNGVTVTYGGQVIDFVINGTSNIWSPNSSFIGGTVTTSPSIVGDDIRLNAIARQINSVIFFSSP